MLAHWGRMNRTVTFGLLISLLSTSVSAAEPTLGERHAALEASLTTNQRTRFLGKNFLRVGGLGFAVAALTAGAGVGVAATTIALTPYVVLAGF